MPTQPIEQIEQLYAELDEALAEGLAAEGRQGVRPSCRAGCSFCCHHAIEVARAEAAPIVSFVKTQLGAVEQAATNERIAAWLRWLATELAGPSTQPLAERVSQRAPACPFLVQNRCSIYAVRPIVCRTHYVTSAPERCLPAARGGPVDVPSARMMHALAERAMPFAKRVRLPMYRDGAAADSEPDRDVLLLAEAYAELAFVQ